MPRNTTAQVTFLTSRTLRYTPCLLLYDCLTVEHLNTMCFSVAFSIMVNVQGLGRYGTNVDNLRRLLVGRVIENTLKCSILLDCLVIFCTLFDAFQILVLDFVDVLQQQLGDDQSKSFGNSFLHNDTLPATNIGLQGLGRKINDGRNESSEWICEERFWGAHRVASGKARTCGRSGRRCSAWRAAQ